MTKLRWPSLIFLSGLSCFSYEYNNHLQRHKHGLNYTVFNEEEIGKLREMNYELFDTRKLVPNIVEDMVDKIKSREDERGNPIVVNFIPRNVSLLCGAVIFPFLVSLTPFHTLISHPVGYLTRNIVNRLNEKEEKTVNDRILEAFVSLGHFYSHFTAKPQNACEGIIENWKMSRQEWSKEYHYQFLQNAFQQGNILGPEENNSIQTLMGDVEIYDKEEKYCTRFGWAESVPFTSITKSKAIPFGRQYRWWAALALCKSGILWYCNDDFQKTEATPEEQEQELSKRLHYASDNMNKALSLFTQLQEETKDDKERQNLSKLCTILTNNIAIIKAQLSHE